MKFDKYLYCFRVDDKKFIFSRGNSVTSATNKLKNRLKEESRVARMYGSNKSPIGYEKIEYLGEMK